MPWDWITYPEFLDSIDRHPKAMNILPFVGVVAILVWVMGLDEAKTGRRFTETEALARASIINEAMDAGGCGWSLQHLGRPSIQPDWDGTPMVTDIMDDGNIAYPRPYASGAQRGFHSDGLRSK